METGLADYAGRVSRATGAAARRCRQRRRFRPSDRTVTTAVAKPRVSGHDRRVRAVIRGGPNVEGVDSGSLPPEPATTFASRAMGSPLRLTIGAALEAGSPTAARAWESVLRIFDAAETAMSRFSETSELTALEPTRPRPERRSASRRCFAGHSSLPIEPTGSRRPVRSESPVRPRSPRLHRGAPRAG